MPLAEEQDDHGNMAKSGGFQFRLALPFGQLVLCAFILWPIRGLILSELGLPRTMDGPPVFFRSGLGRVFLEWSLRSERETIAVINLPAGLVQLPTVFLRADRGEWMPPGVDFKAWRAVTWPVFGMVFWWLAGRGADALLASRRKVLVPRIGWTETVIGFVLAAGGLASVIAFLLDGGPDRHDRLLQVLVLAIGIWGMLGGLTVAARIVQWRMRKILAKIDCKAASSA